MRRPRPLRRATRKERTGRDERGLEGVVLEQLHEGVGLHLGTCRGNGGQGDERTDHSYEGAKKVGTEDARDAQSICKT